MQPGQTLIIILMVMVLSLGTGLAVSSRTSSTIHQTANLANSEQALATAESAMELLLKQPLDATSNLLNVALAAGFNKQADLNPTTPCSSLPCYQDMGGGAKASVTIATTPLVNPTTSPFEFYIERDDVQQVWLNGYDGSVSICWKKGDEVDGSDNPAAISVAVISGSGNYTLAKYAYDSVLSRQPINGFSLPGSGVTPYSYCISPPALVNAQALRIRTYYTGTSVSVAPVSPSPAIPFQGNIITTTGFVADIKRSVEVTKTLPQLSGIFDYGVYSAGEVIK